MRTAWVSLVLVSLALALVVSTRVGVLAASGQSPDAALATAPGRVRVEVRVLPTGTPPVTPIIIPTGGPTGGVTPSTAPPSNLGETVTARPSGTAPVVPSGTARPPTEGAATSSAGVLPVNPAATGAAGMPRTGLSSGVHIGLFSGAVAVVVGLALVVVARRRRDRTG